MRTLLHYKLETNVFVCGPHETLRLRFGHYFHVISDEWVKFITQRPAHNTQTENHGERFATKLSTQDYTLWPNCL